MSVFLHYPGTWLEPGDDRSRLLDDLISICDSKLIAAMTFERLFVSAVSQQGIYDSPEQWALERQRCEDAKSRLRSAHPSKYAGFDFSGQIDVDSSVLLYEDEIRSGALSVVMHLNLHRYFAEAFIDNLNTILNCLILMEGEKLCAIAQTAKAEFERQLPGLRKVRNSLAHIDERHALKGTRGKPFSPKPFHEPGFMHSANGSLVSACMSGDTFLMTDADGNLARVEINPASISIARDCVQMVIDSLTWSGPKRVSPEGH